jgi:hypothetical protein
VRAGEGEGEKDGDGDGRVWVGAAEQEAKRMAGAVGSPVSIRCLGRAGAGQAALQQTINSRRVLVWAASSNNLRVFAHQVVGRAC